MQEKDAPADSEAAMTIRVHTPQHRQANGRPITIVSVVDHDLANKLLDAGKVDQMQEVRRFHSIMIEHHHKVRWGQKLELSGRQPVFFTPFSSSRELGDGGKLGAW